MSVKARVEDAEHLWAAGRIEGAWVQALIAAAATSRKRYPKSEKKRDGDAFKSFICDITHTIVTGEPNGPSPQYLRFHTATRANPRKLEDVLYDELRCNLVHEAELKEVGFSDSVLKDGQLEATLNVPTEGRAEIPDFWVLHLILAIKTAPENHDLFSSTDE